MQRRSVPILSAFGMLLFAAPAVGQTTIFTYQGQLKNNGTPANGNFNMVFRLFDSEAGGSQVGSDFPVAGVPVASGLFTAKVDFGAGVFDSAPRWLEVEVSGQILSPRQEITSAPFAQTALFALSAAGGQWQVSGSDLYYTAGNVGIGRSDPAFKLDTTSANGLGARIGMQDAGGGALVVACNPGDNRVWLEGYNSTNDGHATEMLVTGFAGGALPQLTFNATNTAALGRLGVGTSTPAYPLTIQTSSFFASYGWIHTNGTCELGSYVSAGSGWLGTRTSHPLHFFTADSGARMTLTTAGDLGVGTSTPTARLDSNNSTGTAVAGNCGSGTSTAGVIGRSTASNGNGVIGEANTGSSAYGVWGRASQGIGGVFSGGSLALWAQGRARVNVLEIVGGSDLAEPFDVAEEDVKPGSVVVIDPANPGRMKLAREAYDSKVGGIISGANDLSPGMVMKAEGQDKADGQHSVALTGRVWCLCDADVSPIRPGDLLTTSDTPGHAMRAVDRERAGGAILGKSMTSLKSGRGLVLVLVSLQ